MQQSCGTGTIKGAAMAACLKAGNECLLVCLWGSVLGSYTECSPLQCLGGIVLYEHWLGETCCARGTNSGWERQGHVNRTILMNIMNITMQSAVLLLLKPE